jgi:hypothetical protein
VNSSSNHISASISGTQISSVVAIAMVYSLLWIMNIEYEIAGLSLGKIYSNSMLVLLNNRFTIGGGRNEPTLEFEIQSFHLSDVPRRETNRIGTSPAEVS